VLLVLLQLSLLVPSGLVDLQKGASDTPSEFSSSSSSSSSMQEMAWLRRMTR
jgi:hypothetical protein